MPVYQVLVEIGETKQVHLVEAPNEAQASRYVAKKHLTSVAVRSAEQMKAMAELAAGGVKVETVE